MLRLILLGPPGAGKGTQAAKICDAFNIVQISTGDMLRAAINSGSDLGVKVKQVMDRGDLVDDNLIIALVKSRIAEPDCTNGFLLDGIPRTIAQAQALRDANIHIDTVIELQVADDVVIKRITGRLVDLESGRVYNSIYNPPKVAGIDDLNGNKLIHRKDDSETTVTNRLQVYQRQTEPLIAYYKKWMGSGDPNAPVFDALDANASVEAVYQHIRAKLQELTA